MHAPDEPHGGVPYCPSRDADKYHRADMACEYTVLPQEMTTSAYGGRGGCRADGGGRDDDEPGCRWGYGCSCRRLAGPVSVTPRPADSISYLSGTVDRQARSWRRPMSDDDGDAADDDDAAAAAAAAAHRHCTCSSGRCRQPPGSLRPTTVDRDPRRRQLACYVIASTSDEEDLAHGTATAAAPPDVQTLAPSVVLTQH